MPVIGAFVFLAVAPQFAGWLRSSGWWGVALFMIVYVSLGALALAPTSAAAAVAGWAFGFATGFPAVVIGTLVGSTLCYIGSKNLIGQTVRRQLEHKPRVEVIRRALLTGGRWRVLWIVLLMRLSPVPPSGTTTVLLATAGVRLDMFMVGTLLGLIPRIVLIAVAGASAERLDKGVAENPWLLVIGLLAAFTCVVILTLAAHRALSRTTRSWPQASLTQRSVGSDE